MVKRRLNLSPVSNTGVWKAVRDRECECARTSWCVQGKTDEKQLSSMSHCSAVLYAGLGGDVGPGQQRAQQGLGLSVQPLRDGAGAQAGQG